MNKQHSNKNCNNTKQSKCSKKREKTTKREAAKQTYPNSVRDGEKNKFKRRHEKEKNAQIEPEKEDTSSSFLSE